MQYRVKAELHIVCGPNHLNATEKELFSWLRGDDSVELHLCSVSERKAAAAAAAAAKPALVSQDGSQAATPSLTQTPCRKTRNVGLVYHPQQWLRHLYAALSRTVRRADAGVDTAHLRTSVSMPRIVCRDMRTLYPVQIKGIRKDSKLAVREEDLSGWADEIDF